MTDNAFDQKPLPPKKPEVINPEDEPAESQTDDGNGEGEGKDDKEDPGGIEVPKKPPPPQP